MWDIVPHSDIWSVWNELEKHVDVCMIPHDFGESAHLFFHNMPNAIVHVMSEFCFTNIIDAAGTNVYYRRTTARFYVTFTD